MSEPLMREHKHSFCVDTYCDCGVKLSEFVQWQYHRIAELERELGTVQTTDNEKITTTKLAEQIVEKWALENINRIPITLALSNLLEEVHEALVLAAKGEVVVDEQQYCYTKPD